MGRRNSGGRGLLHLDGEGHASLLIRSRSNNKLRNVYRENTTLTRKKKNLYELDEKITEIILYGSKSFSFCPSILFLIYLPINKNEI